MIAKVNEPSTHSGADLVVDALLDTDVEVAFGYPGGAIMPLYDAILDSPINHVLTRHEQAAIHAADGYARASGRLGVAIATSGPGATNLVTGICTALMDSSPVLCITGQVNTPTIGTDAFQEADVLGIVSTVTKQAFLVRTLHDLPEMLAEAIHIAQTGRPGPVLVDIPKNVLAGKTAGHYEPVTSIPGYHPRTPLDREALLSAHEMLKQAERPVCIVGGGCKLAGAADAFRRWCELTGMPAITTLNGIGAADPDYPALLGMLGMHGLRYANRAVDQADLIIGLGMRFDDRVTGRVDAFGHNARIIHVDIDAAEVGKIIPVDIGVVADLKTALDAWNDVLERDPITPPEAWVAQTLSIGDGLQTPAPDEGDGVSTIDVLNKLFPIIGPDPIVTTDVGQHQMWTAQRIFPNGPRSLITSGGMGTMGSSLSFAMGAQFTDLQRRVLAICGDGGFQMGLSELATVRRCNLPLKILVLDNRFLGMVRQWQEMFFDGRYSAVDLSDNPDFAALARVYGLKAFQITQTDEIESVIKRWWSCAGPALLHCRCRLEENVFPMVPANASLAEMVESTR